MKQLHVAGLVAVVGLLVGAAPASAVTLTATAQNPPLSSGTYQVTINRTGASTYSVVVTGNNDGRTTPGGPLEPVKHSIGNISIGFLTAGGDYIAVDTGSTSGGTTTGGGFIGAPYQVLPDTQIARFRTPSKQNDVAQFGGNAFIGSIALASGQQPNYVTVALQNGTQQWSTFGQLSVVPEPGSLALALPGLAPLAFALLRRRPGRSRDTEETDQDTTA